MESSYIYILFWKYGYRNFISILEIFLSYLYIYILNLFKGYFDDDFGFFCKFIKIIGDIPL